MTEKFSLEELSAYLDGELEDERMAIIEAACAHDAELQRRLDQLFSVDSNIREYCNPILSEPIPERLLSVVQPVTSKKSATNAWLQSLQRFLTPAAMGTAATALVMGILIGHQSAPDMNSSPSSLIIADGQSVVAGATLAKFLDSARSGQVESVDGHEAVIQLSLATQSNGYCRQFRTGALSGLACKDQGAWSIEVMLETMPFNSTQYSLAGDDTPAIISSAISELDGVAVLDAAHEADAIRSNWE